MAAVGIKEYKIAEIRCGQYTENRRTKKGEYPYEAYSP